MDLKHADSSTGLKPRKRRWLQFGVRTFLIAVAIFSIWLGILVNSARRQKAAVAELRAHSAYVYYDYCFKNGKIEQVAPILDATSALPGWLIRTCGDDMFHRVLFVEVIDYRYAGKHLCGLTSLVELRLSSASDDMLACAVRHMPTLERLSPGFALRHHRGSSPWSAD